MAFFYIIHIYHLIISRVPIFGDLSSTSDTLDSYFRAYK